MFGQFLLDKGGDHGAVDLLGHVRAGAELSGQMADLGDDLLDALWCLDRFAVFLEARGLGHIAAACGEQCDDLPVQLVNIVANFFDIAADISHLNVLPCFLIR